MVMKKCIPFAVLGLFVLASCTPQRVDSSSESPSEIGESSSTSSSESSISSIIDSAASSVYAYQKVTSSSALTDGVYLLGVPELGYFLDTSSSSVDRAENYVALSFSGTEISASEEAKNCELVYSSASGSLSLPNGQFLYGSSGVNSLKTSAREQRLTISIDNGGYADIVSNSCHLVFNDTSGQSRFRFYKSSSYVNYEKVALYKKVAITPIYPTAIYLESTISAYVGDSIELKPTYSPSDANVFDYLYTSSNPSVVSLVDGKLKCLSEGSSTVTVSAKTANETRVSASTTITVSQRELDAYTVMIYLCGSDLESSSDARLASANLKEILSVNYPAGVNVIIQTGGSKKWWNYGISSTSLGRYHVENSSLVKDATLPNASMGKASTFQSFIEWGLTEYPAEQTGVVFWNHGGAMGGVCYDENYNDDTLTNSEVHSALQAAFQTTNRTEKLSWIGYDACLMSVADIADFNSDYFDYMISSQEAEPGEGWDYDSWLGAIAKNPSIGTKELGKAVIDSYVAKCGEIYKDYYGSSSTYNDATLALLDLSKADEFATAYEALGAALSRKVTSSTAFRTFGTLCNKAMRFGVCEADDGSLYYPFDVFDLQGLLTQIKSSSTYNTSEISNVESALFSLVSYHKNGTTLASACGLSAFVPVSGYAYRSDYSSSESHYSTWVNWFSQYGTWYY